MATVADYYREAIEDVKKVVAQASDADVMARETESWADHLVAGYALEPIEEDSSRAMHGEEFEAQNSRPGHFDIMTGGPIGPTRAALRMFLPVVPTTTLDEIWNRQLSPNTYSTSHGYRVTMVVESRVGYRIYEDAVQVIAEPFSDTQTG